MSNSPNTLINTETDNTNITEVPDKEVTTGKVTNESIEEVSSSEVSPSPTSTEFNRANIEALGNHIHLVDSDEENKLDMFCYVKCAEDDNELLKKCRGVVFNESNLVMKAFPYTTEYNHTETNDIERIFSDVKKWRFFEAHEGALVRMFYFGNKWYVSTHRKLNAFRSKWASRDSFGTSFKSALTSEEETNEDFKKGLPDGDNILERFQSTLDQTKQYMFLVRNTSENRIVCDAPDRPTVFHVGTFVDGELAWDEDIKIPSPAKLEFKTVDELVDYVKKSSYKQLQGVICFDDSNDRVIKLIHKDYQDLFHARGNEPSIKFRYLQIRMNRRFANMLYHLYPNMSTVFDEYENTLYDVARSIYRAYVQRFIKKRYVTVPREEFAVIRECHSWHLEDRTENRISINKIIEIMNQQSPTHLNHMIRRFKLEQTRQKEQQSEARPRSDSVRSNKSFEQSPAIHRTENVPVSPLMLPENGKQRKSVNKGRTNHRQVATIAHRKPLHKPKTVKEESDVETN